MLPAPAEAACYALSHNFSYRKVMGDIVLDLNQPVPLTADEDEEVLAAIDRGVQAADEGQTVPLEEVRTLIPHWLSKSASRSQRS